MQLLDKFLPNFDFHEVHTITVQSPPERVFCAIKEITPGEMPLVRALFTIRNLPALLLRRGGLPFAGEQPLLAQALRGGFVLLAEEANREVVLGTIGQFWQINGNVVKVPDAQTFLTFDHPGYAKAA